MSTTKAQRERYWNNSGTVEKKYITPGKLEIVSWRLDRRRAKENEKLMNSRIKEIEGILSDRSTWKENGNTSSSMDRYRFRWEMFGNCKIVRHVCN